MFGRKCSGANVRAQTDQDLSKMKKWRKKQKIDFEIYDLKPVTNDHKLVLGCVLIDYEVIFDICQNQRCHFQFLWIFAETCANFERFAPEPMEHSRTSSSLHLRPNLCARTL